MLFDVVHGHVDVIHVVVGVAAAVRHFSPAGGYVRIAFDVPLALPPDDVVHVQRLVVVLQVPRDPVAERSCAGRLVGRNHDVEGPSGGVVGRVCTGHPPAVDG